MGNDVTLTMSVQLDQVFDVFNTADRLLSLTGRFVARGVIPEPAMAGVLLLGSVMLCVRRRRRSQ